MGQPQKIHIDITDYVTTERQDDQRYEYHRGELFAMAGGSIDHSTICNNVSGELRNAVKNRGTCISFNSEMKLEVERAGRYVYADAGVACPKFKASDVIPGAIVNPRVVVEVVSTSSEGYDRGSKFRYYFSIPTVREYLLIEQDEARITLYRRQQSDELFRILVVEGLESSVLLESIQVTLALEEVYRDVEFGKE